LGLRHLSATSSFLFLSFSLFMQHAMLAFTAEGIQPISLEELKMTSESLAAGVPAIILFSQVDRTDDCLTAHEDNYICIKILREEGRSEAEELKKICRIISGDERNSAILKHTQ
jgi:hypothetical protein